MTPELDEVCNWNHPMKEFKLGPSAAKARLGTALLIPSSESLHLACPFAN